LAATAATSPAGAQTAALPEQPLLGLTVDADLLHDLPTTNNPFTVLETIPEVTTDRFSSGGLGVATAPRLGGFLNSWTQTQLRLGEIAITDPRTGGTPLLLPILPLWQRMTTATAAMGVDENAPGVSMRFEPVRPAARWFRVFEGTASGPSLVSDRAGDGPAVDRVRQWRDASAMVSGPVTDRFGLVAAASWRSLSHVAAPATSATSDRVTSQLAHLVFAATPRDEARALVWAQQVTTDAFTDAAVHVQATWERHDPGSIAWRLFGGYTERRRSVPQTSFLVVDSLTSDPVSDLLDTGAGTARRWTIGARVAPRATPWWPTAGIDVEGAQVRLDPTGIAQIGELVDHAPARLWVLRPVAGPDIRHITTFAAHGNEHVTFGRLSLDAGVRLDTVNGAADSAARGIQWTNWLPRAMAQWRVVDTARVSVLAGYRRSAYQLPLNVLAVGDPAAPVADVAAWRGASAGPLIARVGPGTGGDLAFTEIDPQLRRPVTDELVLAIQSRPRPWLHLQLARITKREDPLLGVVDTGVAASDYMPFAVPDPSFVPDNPFGAPTVTAYNRPASSYGRDRYRLTNRAVDPADSWGLEASVRVSTDRLTIFWGGTLTEADGSAAAVGFLPTENDQDVLGNLLVDPNAATKARGQLFPDRSHTVKMAGVYRFPWRLRVGWIARYQDGQPFARLVVVPNLTQGPTAVRSYTNGGSAFSYVGTLDVRVQKDFAVGAAHMSAVVEVHNLPSLGNEVTEYIVSGPMFRTPIAAQPPLTAVIGVRVGF
jgi:hypothetical protein